MPTQPYATHEPVKEVTPFLRNSLDGIYVASFEKDKLFHLKDLTFVDGSFPEESEPGWIMKKNPDGSFEDVELDQSVKEQLTEDEEVIAVMNKTITEHCTGKTYYDVAWWSGTFNNFMNGFCNRHFEV